MFRVPQTTSRPSSRRRAFTLVELVIAMVILGILATFVGVTYNRTVDDARRRALEMELHSLVDEVWLLTLAEPGMFPADSWYGRPDWMTQQMFDMRNAEHHLAGGTLEYPYSGQHKMSEIVSKAVDDLPKRTVAEWLAVSGGADESTMASLPAAHESCRDNPNVVFPSSAGCYTSTDQQISRYATIHWNQNNQRWFPMLFLAGYPLNPSGCMFNHLALCHGPAPQYPYANEAEHLIWDTWFFAIRDQHNNVAFASLSRDGQITTTSVKAYDTNGDGIIDTLGDVTLNDTALGAACRRLGHPDCT